MVASAGNYAKYHWSGTFADADGDGLGEFAPGDEGNEFATQGGELVCAYLKWDAWPTTAVDYDLLLQTAAGEALRRLCSPQTGGAAARPRPSASSPAGRHVRARDPRPAGRRTLRLDVLLIATARGTLQHQMAAGSLARARVRPAGARSTVAICWQTGSLPRTARRDRAIGGGLKPDLAGFDSVSSATYGAFTACEKSGFSGTSAAAPHIAGAAALLKQRHPSFGPAELQARLEATAADLGAPGKDTVYGAGRLRLPCGRCRRR